MIGGGVAIFDANNDGLQDLFITGGANNNGFYINNGESFDEKVAYLNSEDVDYYYYQCVGVNAVDFNNDGYKDLFLCTKEGFSNLILINNKDNTFDVIPDSISGILGSEWSIGSAIGDVNKDGWVDIMVCNYSNLDPDPNNPNSSNSGDLNFLYISQGELQYKEMASEYGLESEGASLSGIFTDLDKDDDVDLMVLNDFGAIFDSPNEVYENDYPNQNLIDIGESSGGDLSMFAMGIAAGDIDNDADLDFYLTNIGRNVLLQNNGDKTFTDITNSAGVQDSSVSDNFFDGMKVGWGTGFMDFDNDGYLDIYVSNGYLPFIDLFSQPNAFYLNNGDGTFDNVSEDVNFNSSALCRGSAYGDLDNDGDLDLVVVPASLSPIQFPGITSRQEVLIYYNETENNNSSIGLELEGTLTNGSAIGAQVYVYDDLGNAYYKEVISGSSHCSSNSTVLHFGLGQATVVDSIVVDWTNGISQTIENLDVNQAYTICEEECLSTAIYNSNSNITDRLFNSYPNPTNNVAYIDLADKLVSSYKLYSIEGRLLEVGLVDGNQIKIELNGYHQGTYLIKLFTKNDFYGTSKIVKN